MKKTKMSFNKKENWVCTFYSIIEDKHGNKLISIRKQIDVSGRTNPKNKNVSLMYVDYYGATAAIDYLLEYGGAGKFSRIRQFMSDNEEDIEWFECIEDAYNMANTEIKGEDGNGSKELCIYDVDESTPCGNYYW